MVPKSEVVTRQSRVSAATMRFSSLFCLSLVVLLSTCRRDDAMQTTGALRVEATRLDFGGVYIGATKSLVVVVVNTGRAPVSVTPETSAPFTVAGALRVAGGERVEVPVTFTPASIGAVAATLTLAEDLQVQLDGAGLEVPACAASACATSTFSFDEGRCVETLLADDTACDPGCGAVGACVQGDCRAVRGGSCDDGNPCTIDACAADGGCVALPRECPVTSGCKVASCEPSTGCVETPVEDGIACGEPTCAEGRVCLAGTCETRRRADAAEQCSYVDVAAHGFSACAKNRAGVTRCWGDNGVDQLLRGAPTSSVAPAAWPVGFEVASFTGGASLCAIDADGRLTCPSIFDGGSERFASLSSPYGLCGVLTDGGLSRCLDLPGPAREALSPARKTWSSDLWEAAQCVQGVDGGVGCWGNKSLFSSGTGNGFERLQFDTAPVDLFVNRGVWALMPDGGVETRGHALEWLATLPEGNRPWAAFAVDTYSQHYAWGHLADGTVETCAMADDDAGFTTRRPCAPLAGNHVFTKIRAGDLFACGLDAQQRVWCWGNNQYGQLGEPAVAQTPRTLPLEDVEDHEGNITCFRDGGCKYGDARFASPGPIDDMCRDYIRSGRRVWRVDADGGLHEQALDGGAVSLSSDWSGFSCGTTQRSEDGTEQVVGSFSSRWTCARHGDGGVDCNGEIPFEANPIGTRYVINEPVPMPAVTVLRSSGLGICALTANGRVWCWGAALGYSTVGEVPLVGVRQLECSDHACCALHGSNGVSCWGDNQRNQLGANGPPSLVPRAVSIDEPVKRLNHVAQCVTFTSGRVRCWSRSATAAPVRSETPIQLTK